MDGLILQLILVFIAAAILIVVILNLIQGKKNNKIKCKNPLQKCLSARDFFMDSSLF